MIVKMGRKNNAGAKEFYDSMKNCVIVPTLNEIEKWCIDNSDNKNFTIESTWQPSKDGLGYWFVLEWLNVHGNLKIGIPNREHYLSAFQSEATKQCLI